MRPSRTSVPCSLLTLVLVAGCGSPNTAEAGEVERVKEFLVAGEHLEASELEITEHPGLPLPAVHLFDVIYLMPDHPGFRCVSGPDSVTCADALSAVVRWELLGTNPTTLTDAQWVELVLWSSRATALSAPGDLQWIGKQLPEEEAKQIRPPSVLRGEGGVHVALYFERISYADYPAGPMALMKLDVHIKPDNTVDQQTEEVWSHWTNPPDEVMEP